LNEFVVSAFARYIGIDYSGAETPTASLSGLRVYMAKGDAPPAEMPPPPSPRKYWTRRGIAEWLVERLAENAPALVGIDHGFSFSLAISRYMASSLTGLRSSTTSSSIGRPTTTTPMWISSVMARWATEAPAWATAAGGD
jgi:hypothetical protein